MKVMYVVYMGKCMCEVKYECINPAKLVASKLIMLAFFLRLRSRAALTVFRSHKFSIHEDYSCWPFHKFLLFFAFLFSFC